MRWRSWLGLGLLLPAVALAARVDRVAVGDTRDPALRGLQDEHWRWVQQTDPRQALAAGDMGALTRFENRSPDTLARTRREADQLLGRLRQQDPTALSQGDRETWVLLERSLQGAVDRPLCALDRWLVTEHRNPFHETARAGLGRDLSGPMAIRLVARVERLPVEVENEIRRLRLGLASGRMADRESVERTIAALTALQQTPLDQWDLTAPAGMSHPDWRVEVVGAFSTELMAAARDHAAPALAVYLAFLQDELLPVSRDAAVPGLAGLSGGEACYAERVAWHTTLPLAVDALHALGLAELARLQGELAALGLPLETLRTDQSLRYTRGEDVVDAVQDATRDAWAALRQVVPRRPKVAVTVDAMTTAWAGGWIAAYYQSPPRSGERPGRVFVNTFRPESRYTFEARALAFHEGVPGHHLQSTLGVTNQELPAFRRSSGPSVLSEGWGLYAEGLAEELGLYPTDLDRAGRLTMEAWRAARLVVDTGLHARGWSRARAVDFLIAETALSPDEAAVEVERYLAHPGQALAYAVGAQELWRQRARAEEVLGDAFELTRFHLAVLEAGGLTVGLLRERVDAWIAEVQAG